MRKRIALPSLAVAVLVFAAVSSGGAVVTKNSAHGLTFSAPTSNPCSGATGTITIVSNFTFHTTENANSFHVTETETGNFSFVPDDPSQPSARGHFTDSFGFDANKNGRTVETQNFKEVAHLSDGSQITFHALFHITVNANGDVTAFIDKVELGCP